MSNYYFWHSSLDELREDDIFGIDETFYYNMIKAAPMHDLGKIAVDDAVLRKPGRFTPEEFEKMKEGIATVQTHFLL